MYPENAGNAKAQPDCKWQELQVDMRPTERQAHTGYGLFFRFGHCLFLPGLYELYRSPAEHFQVYGLATEIIRGEDSPPRLPTVIGPLDQATRQLPHQLLGQTYCNRR
jgi:hypothetical protein